jgi:uncharacterized membrane protein SpoIIM required for sporulation
MGISKEFFLKHPKLSCFLIFEVFTVSGFLTRYSYDFYLDSRFHYCPSIGLDGMYVSYIMNDIPRIHQAFFTTLGNNFRSVLTILLLPFCAFGLISFCIGNILRMVKEEPVWYRNTLQEVAIWFPVVRAGICLTAVIWGWNTFDDLFCDLKQLPAPLVFSQFPQALLEIPAFILAGCLALTFVDETEGTLRAARDFTLKNVAGLLSMTVKKYAGYIILILVGILVAAVVETWVTPVFFTMSLGNYLHIQNVTFSSPAP